jgi:hypothetical protein
MAHVVYDLSEAAAAVKAGGILSAILKAQGGAFYVELETRSAGVASLVKTKDRTPRAFANPVKAFEVIRELGLSAGRFALEQWRPQEADFERRTRPDVARAMKAKHQWSEAFGKLYDAEVAASLADPRPNVSHEEVEQEAATRRAALMKRIGRAEAKS